MEFSCIMAILKYQIKRKGREEKKMNVVFICALKYVGPSERMHINKVKGCEGFHVD